MAASAQEQLNKDLAQLVQEKVAAELDNISPETIKGTKTAKDAAAAILPSLATIISVAVSTAVSTAIQDIADKLVRDTAEVKRINLLQRYDNDRLEQYTRRDNLRIFGIEEELEEDEDILQAKVIEVAADVGVTIEPNDISTTHRLGKQGERSRPVIVRFTHRKNRNAVIRNKKELKKKNKKIFINEDLTPLRATMLKMVKEQSGVKSFTTRDGRILVWLEGSQRPVEVVTPDDLHKVGINAPDWKMLKLEYLIQ